MSATDKLRLTWHDLTGCCSYTVSDWKTSNRRDSEFLNEKSNGGFCPANQATCGIAFSLALAHATGLNS